MNDQSEAPKGPGPPWPVSDREATSNVANIDARITVFSIRVLGYDPESNDPKPRELLEWVRHHQAVERWRRQILGAGITAAITAVLGGVCWPLIQYLHHILGS
jgi:hypothetical protein